MRERWSWMLVGALSTVLFVVLSGARPVASDAPPHVVPGALIYGVEFDRPTDQVLPGTGPVTPIEIIGNQGNWFLVETPSQPRGPQWINFDQVVSYRTEQ